MKKLFFVAMAFLVSCASPTVFKTNRGMEVSRYFSGPTPQEITEIENLAVEHDLCFPWELKGIQVEVFPINKLFSSNTLEATHGKSRYDEESGISYITVAGRYDFSCRVFLHEVAHACIQQRWRGRVSGHSNNNVWAPRADGTDDLNSKFLKEVARVCP